ncbi:bifunctional [glutamine synthetase] adenylyltransferase/[glutamine synthetase]-adenylyl-L-tyrosine phosphorylase [Fodinicurvata fenggangensis]|uniref:bifunctional [glutamine synthetase] adenylyltransferase/[glutamine synthetase]-adenylyl-L-tyrosine phosphorylase n=1 Tax=Fodinicurvata fenggangensis TaxID=1121830 RepID=UPI00047BF06B|nr:bifunctional [glutamine synthetase] adenylyltransferase/[glutamine synthetase]-adenylyl-L-tyrosine phosphorylase [Fodinicurvata fenggangensis]
MSSSLLSRLATLPPPGDNERTSVGRKHLAERLQHLDEEQQGKLNRILEHAQVSQLLDVIFGYSPYLTQCLLSDLLWTGKALEQTPEATFQEILTECENEVPACEDTSEAMRILRKARKRVSLLLGLCDISGLLDVTAVTEQLSAFADTVINAAVSHLLLQADTRGEIRLKNRDYPLTDCGYLVIAMGKYGARELNYSSDIDLIVLYSPEHIDYRGSRDLQSRMVRLTQDLARMLDERTAEGYVFRTDLRLRPDPGATPLALSVNAALSYYESTGQNWERAAMIKARAAAGDLELGAWFLNELAPFVWRKHLDFWTIQDIHSIKRQIHAQKGGSAIEVEGHNIKLGRGGIREIEFFAQVQQLIFGGREPTLRPAKTLDALAQLAQAERISAEAHQDLYKAYRFLRTLEHRLQMVEDQQTHSLPETADGLSRIAGFMGHPTPQPFRDELLGHLRNVERHYAELFEEAPSLAGPGNLVFTGGEPEPETLKTLRTLGYQDGEKVFHTVRAWHHGRYRATRSTRARQILTELMPAIIGQFGETLDPDTALSRFDAFLAGLPAGVQLFSLLYQNPKLLDVLGDIMGRAPALADHLSRNAGLLEAVLDSNFFDPLPDRETLENHLQEELNRARDFEDCLDVVRRWTADHRFQVGVQILRSSITSIEASRALSDLAEAVIRALTPTVEAQMAEQHGVVPDGGLLVLALGKLGGREMTFSSDLDLVFLYQTTDDHAESDGRKPLSASVYYGRLAQRIITALTALTAEGQLYEVDPRLRPSGAAGPIALSVNGFAKYELNDAWTWEHMALTKGRVIYGPTALQNELKDRIHEVLTKNRDPEQLLLAVHDMRGRITKEHPGKSIWDCKYVRGGLYDLDFLAQYLQLQHAADHPQIISPSSEQAFSEMAQAGLIGEDEKEDLSRAIRLFRQVQNFLRLTVGENFDEGQANTPLKVALARATEYPTFEELKDALTINADTVTRYYRQRIELPAQALTDTGETRK